MLSVNVNDVRGPGTEIWIFPAGELLSKFVSLVLRKGPLVAVVPTDVPFPITLEPIGTVYVYVVGFTITMRSDAPMVPV